MMKIPRRSTSHAPSVPVTDMTAEQFEDFITDIRIPALHAERDVISAQLADLFQSIGHLVDPEWSVSKDVDDVHQLLTGGIAPSPTYDMPAAALHYALQVRRRNIDRALHQAQAYQSNCIARRQAAVVDKYRPEIDKLERERVTTARVLQAINRRREELREKISEAGGGRVVFSTDSVDLLELPRAGDPVDWATRRALADKILTQSEAAKAAR
jgi:hypothetical protein